MGQAFSSQPAVPASLVQPCLIGDETTVKTLLEKAEDPAALIREQDAAGNHALGAACCGGKQEIVKHLLDLGVDESLINLSNDMGTSPVWLAAGYGHADILDLLLEKGGNPSLASQSGDTPLMAAISRNHDVISLKLIELGVDINATNKNNDSAVSLASSLGNTAVLKALCSCDNLDDSLINQANGKGILPLLAACANHDGSCVELLCEKGARVGVKDRNGATPLHVAAHCGNAGAIRTILTIDQSLLEEADPNGATPLWVACAGGHYDAAKTLIQSGARLDGVTSQDMTIRQAAQRSKSQELIDLVSPDSSTQQTEEQEQGN